MGHGPSDLLTVQNLAPPTTPTHCATCPTTVARARAPVPTTRGFGAPARRGAGEAGTLPRFAFAARHDGSRFAGGVRGRMPGRRGTR